ncbi:MAG: response regulator transcription factor [Actinobacteria bacterium]|nr:response regulator transcription factor [Actinomycetota bacterium]
MKSLIYVVDDDPNIREILEVNLSREGYLVKVFAEGDSLINEIDSHVPDLIILDIMLPRISGLDLCKIIKSKIDVPILFLSVKAEEFDKVLGLEIGADDYLTKPFGIKELIARVKVLLRRSRALNDHQKIIRFGDLEIDVSAHELRVGSNILDTTPKEFEIMRLLAEKPDKVVKRMEIIRAVWGDDYFGDTRTLDVHVRRLRAKIHQFTRHNFIETVHGIGYKFVKTAL